MNIRRVLEIRNNFLNNLKNTLSKIEGTYNFDIASAVALALNKLYGRLEYWEKQLFIDTATEDEYIDKHARLFGVIRRKAIPASGEVTIQGNPGTLVVEGTIVLSRRGLRYKTQRQVYLDGSGIGKAAILCLEPGEKGNCAPGEITSFEIANTNLFSVTNEKAVKGGFEKEPNETLVARAKEKVMQPAHSGNINDYIQWSKEVDGVGNVHVIPLWNGPGTVKVLVSDYNYEEAQSDLIARVKKRLENETGRPIGAQVTVESFLKLEIQVGGTVYLEKGYNLTEVKKVIEADLRVALRQGVVSYKKLHEGTEKTVISLNKIERLALNTPGVVDCSLTLNGHAKNVETTAEYLSILKGVDLSET